MHDFSTVGQKYEVYKKSLKIPKG